MMFIALVAVLSTSLVMSANVNLATADNSGKVFDARLAAESGVEFITYQLRSVELTTGATIASVLDALATAIATELDGTSNLAGQAVSYDDTTLTIPTITLNNGGSFSATIVVEGWNTLLVTITGQVVTSNGTISRTIAMEAKISSGGASNYSVYAKGPVYIGNNVELIGVNNDDEASIVSAASGEAITIGSGSIQGSIATVDPDATVDIGSTDVSGSIISGVEVPPPTIDISVFTPFIGSQIITDTTDIGSVTTLTNATIQAGTNPTFPNGNDMTILGVLYIESPNVVTFNNNCSMTGVIITQTPAEGSPPEDNCVYFKNNLSVASMSELPEIEEFATLRTMTGSAFLMPGFKLEFNNNFTSVSGNIAAEQIIVKNNLDCTIQGNIFALGDAGLEFKNNSSLVIDTSGLTGSGPGLMRGDENIKKTLMLLPDTYAEN